MGALSFLCHSYPSTGLFCFLIRCADTHIWSKNIKPLYIREGGSIPSLPFLEQIFGARAVQFPMGTSSDGAHLANERIRVINLEVRFRVFMILSCSDELISFRVLYKLTEREEDCTELVGHVG